MTINDFKEQYFQDFIADGNATSSKGTYDTQLKNFISYLESLKVTTPKEITARTVKDYLGSLRLKNGEAMSDNSRYSAQSAIKGFLRYLYENDYIEVELGAKLKSIKIHKKESAYLSPEQYSHFIFTVKKQSTSYYRDRDLALMYTLIKSGIRRAELVNLNISDIDLSQAKIWIKRKGGNEGFIPLLNELVEDLDKYLKTLKRDGNEPLFMSKLGQRLSASSVWHLVKRYASKAGLSQKITVHSLRHGFATKLNDSGVPIPIIQKLMGHRSPTTTYRYLHITDINVRKEFNDRVTFDERG